MGVSIQGFLKARRDRAVGSIMGYAEREIWPKLSPTERAAFRTKVLSSMDGYHDSVLDLVKADTDVRNEEVIAALDRLDATVRRSQALKA